MPLLSADDRAGLRADLAKALSRDREPIAVTKAEVLAAVNAMDQWVDDNAASFNQAIPEPARSALTANQKARLLAFIVRRRWEVL